jgi:hypothetical protein
VLCAGFTLLLGEDTPTSSCIWRPCSECHEASKHHLLKFGFLLLVRFNLGFIAEGRLATLLIIPSSWGSQRDVLTSHQAPWPSTYLSTPHFTLSPKISSLHSSNPCSCFFCSRFLISLLNASLLLRFGAFVLWYVTPSIVQVEFCLVKYFLSILALLVTG